MTIIGIDTATGVARTLPDLAASNGAAADYAAGAFGYEPTAPPPDTPRHCAPGDHHWRPGGPGAYCNRCDAVGDATLLAQPMFRDHG